MRRSLIVAISQLPYPLDRGDAVRTAQILNTLPGEFSVQALCVRRPTSTRADEDALREAFPDVQFVFFDADDAERGSVWRRVARWARCLLKGLPPWIDGRYSTALHSALRQVAPGSIFLALGDASGNYVGKRQPWHWDRNNILSASAAQEFGSRRFATVSWCRSLLLLAMVRRYERRVLRCTTSISVISVEEEVRLAHQGWKKRVALWPSAVDLPDSVRRHPRPQRLAWLGMGGYPANRDGLHRFVQELEQMSLFRDYELVVIGGGWSQKDLHSYAHFSNIHFLGYVENLVPVLDECVAGVVPLWYGAGVKMKTLQLMAHGVPVFGTPVAFEGVAVKAEWACVASSAQEIIELVNEKSCDELEVLGREMKKYVKDFHSSGALGRSVRESLVNLDRS
jgi:glycosyltransferase involved in cell wall biosynthesis